MSNPIILKKGLKIGELDAEADINMLRVCFVDNGALDRLLDINDHAAIILGRTGSGKSALLLQVKERSEHSRQINPHNISVRFLEHSNIIQFLDELEIKLDLFYKVLWKHILIVEILKLRYNISSEAEARRTVASICNRFLGDKTRQKALDYFLEWSDKFWLEVDEQLKELTEKFSRDIKAELGAKYESVDISLEGARSLSNEQRVEIKPRASQVVSRIQIQRLNEVFDLLANHAFTDKQKHYFVLIDQLDEDWAETETRYRFIRALIEEIKTFRHIPNIKILVALRQDLLEMVFNRTRDAGFQEEKYEAYLLSIKWTKDELSKLIETRISELFRRQYTKDQVSFSDIFPAKPDANKESALEYIISRTLFRPRDALQFANECLATASNRERVSWTAIHSAEGTYSSKRLKSLQEEWGNIYPALSESVNILRGLRDSFTRNEITKERLESICLSLVNEVNALDPCVIACKQLYQPGSNFTEADVISEFLRCFYLVGIIGI